MVPFNSVMRDILDSMIKQIRVAEAFDFENNWFVEFILIAKSRISYFIIFPHKI